MTPSFDEPFLSTLDDNVKICHQAVAALELLYNIDYVGIVRIECYSGLATGWRDNTVSG